MYSLSYSERLTYLNGKPLLSSEKKREVHYYICVENAGVQGSQTLTHPLFLYGMNVEVVYVSSLM